MKVLVTLDYYDGRRSKSKVRHLDEVDTSWMRLTMMQKDVCGVTITKYERLDRAVDKLNPTEKTDDEV